MRGDHGCVTAMARMAPTVVFRPSSATLMARRRGSAGMASRRLSPCHRD